MNDNIGREGNNCSNGSEHSFTSGNAIILDEATERLVNATSSSNRNHEVIEEILELVERKAPKLLDGLATDNRIRIARLCQVKLYSHGDIVFRQGDEPDGEGTIHSDIASMTFQDYNS